MLGKTVNNKFIEETAEPIGSGKTLLYEAYLFNERKLPIAASDLTELKLTIIDRSDGGIVNSVEGIDILNTGRGSIDSHGKLTITLEPEDTLLPEGAKKGVYELIIEWVYGGGKTGGHQVGFKIVRLI